MRCFVSGASGFIGANLVHELVARGHCVKALLRPNSNLRGLKGADFERVNGEVSDQEKLVGAMRGCDWCFHVAASYSLWLRDYGPQFRIESYTPITPSTALGIERYLGSGLVPGVGAALAKRIVERFGERTLVVIEDEPWRLREVVWHCASS